MCTRKRAETRDVQQPNVLALSLVHVQVYSQQWVGEGGGGRASAIMVQRVGGREREGARARRVALRRQRPIGPNIDLEKLQKRPENCAHTDYRSRGRTERVHASGGKTPDVTWILLLLFPSPSLPFPLIIARRCLRLYVALTHCG